MMQHVGKLTDGLFPRWTGCGPVRGGATAASMATTTLNDLVERFALQEKSLLQGGYKETPVRREFIDPFFKLLGWDIDNESGFAEPYKDVVHEDDVDVEGRVKSPDYAFRVGGQRKFFVEAKRPSVRIDGDKTTAYQLRRYAWSAKLPISVSTNFRELAIYDGRIKPQIGDRPDKGRILYATFDQLEERWGEIADLLSKTAILKGSHERFTASNRTRGSKQVDDAFLEEIDAWRASLAADVAKRNRKLTIREVNHVVQVTIDRIVFLRICEDRGIEPHGTLKILSTGRSCYRRLADLFRAADERYNSGLFHFRREKDQIEPPDGLTLDVTISDAVLQPILRNLYYPHSPYEFSVLGADILGQVYERFLGRTIAFAPDHSILVEEKPEVRKAGGVYYTPTNVVDFIVRQTVGPLLADKTPRQVSQLRILDPACGSGSFLLRVYQYLLDWHLAGYVAAGDKASRSRIVEAGGGWRLTAAERKRILTDHVFGVDLDPQAVEVTKLSLLLKVLEGENAESLDAQLKLFRERALPDIGANIRCGNSLIGEDFYDDQPIDLFDVEERYRVNSFEWNGKNGFRDIMAAGRFDAIVGNPPYIRVRTYKELFPAEAAYLEERYRFATHSWDVYGLFFEKALSLVGDGGAIGFIVPVQTLHQPNFERLRRTILNDATVSSVTDLSHLRVFTTAVVKTCVLVLRTTKPAARGKGGLIDVLSPSTFGDLVEPEFRQWPQREARSNPGSSLKVDLLSGHRRLCEKLARASHALDDLCYVTNGLRSCAPGKGQGGKDRLIVDRPRGKEARPYLEGRDIHRYGMDDPGRYILYRPKEMYSPRSPELFDGRKIVSQTMLSRMRPVATIDEGGHYVEQSLLVAVPHGVVDEREPSADLPLEYILAAMNSRLQAYYFGTYIIDHSLGGGLIHATPGSQSRFIVPKAEPTTVRKVVTLVQQMVAADTAARTARLASEQAMHVRRLAQLDAAIDDALLGVYSLDDDELALIEDKVPEG